MAAHAHNQQVRRGLWTDFTCRHGADLKDVMSYWAALALRTRTKPQPLTGNRIANPHQLATQTPHEQAQDA